MYPFHRVKIKSYEAGLVFREGEFSVCFGPGRHWFFNPLGRLRSRSFHFYREP